jgi:hypothetical protein
MHRDNRLSAEQKKVLEDELSAQIDTFVNDLSVLVNKEYEQLLDSIYIDLTDGERGKESELHWS